MKRDKSRNVCAHCGRQPSGTWYRPVCLPCNKDGKTPHIIRLPAGEWSKVSPADKLAYVQRDQYRLDTAETPEKRQQIEHEIAAKQIGQPTPPKKGRQKKRR